MTINKFQGKTEEEAIALAKEKMGQDVLIMSGEAEGTFRFLKDQHVRGHGCIG